MFYSPDSHEIEKGADRIVTQVLAPRMLSIFEPKIGIAVNEYLGIKNETPSIDQNGMLLKYFNCYDIIFFFPLQHKYLLKISTINFMKNLI